MSAVNEQQVETIELSIEQSQKMIDTMDSLDRLTRNNDFIKVINEGYFEKEASRLVLLKADPNMQKDEDQKLIDNSINAVGYFRQYLSTIYQLGRMAERSIEADKQTREELLAEGID